MTPSLTTCETTAAITVHLRDMGEDEPLHLSGFVTRPVALCGALIAWDTLIPVDGARCSECIAIACLAMAVPAERCPDCRIFWDLGHEVRCPVVVERFCAICGASGHNAFLAPSFDSGQFELHCARCSFEHPRSGRYSFVEAGCGGTAHHGIGKRGAM